jgi:hypothetical protein
MEKEFKLDVRSRSPKLGDRGQVFTLDMFLALTLTALLIGYSGVAFEHAFGASSYLSRLSLERIANDAADVLVKTLGIPSGWENDVKTLAVPGLAEESDGEDVPATLDIMKFARLRFLMQDNVWDDPQYADAVEALRKLFGGSEKFEIRVLDENENLLWYAFPRWSPGEESGAENAFEVVVARRLVSVRYGSAVRSTTGRIEMAPQPYENYLYFFIAENELATYDWYIVSLHVDVIGNIKIWVNRDSGLYDYIHTEADPDMLIFPDPDEVPHGGLEADNKPLYENENNFLFVQGPTPSAGQWFQVYLVVVPECTDPEDVALMIQPLPAILEVRVWR